jgi:hypothetical protein
MVIDAQVADFAQAVTRGLREVVGRISMRLPEQVGLARGYDPGQNDTTFS